MLGVDAEGATLEQAFAAPQHIFRVGQFRAISDAPQQSHHSEGQMAAIERTLVVDISPIRWFCAAVQ